MKDNGFKDSRLLEAFNHIDPRFIAEVADDLKIEPEYTPEHGKKAARRSIKYALALAACLVLISAVLPVISYLTGRLGLTPGGTPAGSDPESESVAEVIDSETVDDTEESESAPETTEEEFELPEPEGGLTYIEPVGEVPAEFKDIVENNLLGGGYLIGDTIVGYYRDGDRYRVSTKDKYGNVLTSALIGSQNQWPSEVFVDSEKNMIVVLWVNTTVGSAPSGHYKIVKIDPSGKTVFEKSMTTVEAGYDYMFEVDEGYMFVGNCDGEKNGTITTTDISALLLSRDGNLVGCERIGGDDFDTLYRVIKNGNGVSIYYFRHTKDRNGGYQRCDVSVKGNIQSPEHTEITVDDIPDYVYFTIDGKPYYETSDFFTEYNFDETTGGGKVFEYDTFVLHVYTRYTSVYRHSTHGMMSFIQPISYYRETVYAAYTKTGELIWRTAVDSTDYDFLREYYKDR